MSTLASLVEDLPVSVQRIRRVRIEEGPLDAYTEEARTEWLDELDREAEVRGEMLPNVRAARRLFGEDLQRAILADLVYELNRTVKRPQDEAPLVTGWGRGVKDGDDERMPVATAIKGPAPVTNMGVRATLRSYLDAQEPCDRHDALIRHAATCLLLAEQIAVGRA
jgi:hypothetical protein